jgi:hypothetical protein
MKTQSILTMVLPTNFALQLGELFDLQMELKQCKKERLGADIYRFTIEVPVEKGSKIKNYILETISRSKNLNLN